MTFRAELDDVVLRLELPGVGKARELRTTTIHQLDDYVLPRLVQLDAPLLMVVGGSTGAGKSTLVNSLVGAPVSRSGVLRPTTRSPVLVHHPADAHWFGRERILPDLARTDTPTTDVGSLHLISSENVPLGLAILDAPDVDSVDGANRALAGELLAAADLWLFVTSASRYADEVPWDFLSSAADRRASVAVVLDRTPPESLEEVRVHLARMLTSRGLKDSPLFSVPESKLDGDGLLDLESVGPVRDWLTALAADADARRAVIAQTLEGAVRQSVTQAYDISDAVTQQVDASMALHAAVDDAYADVLQQIRANLEDGSLLRGELLVRWRGYVGGGDLLRSLERRVGRIRDRVVDNLRGRVDRSAQVREELRLGLQQLIIQQGENAAGEVLRQWSRLEPGQVVLAGDQALGRASRGLPARAERVVRDWQDAVVDLVRAESADKRMSARFLALGLDGVALAVMVLAVAPPPLVAASDPAVDDFAAVARDLLASLVDSRTVDRLADQARADLLRNAAAALQPEAEAYRKALRQVDVDPGAADRARDAARALDDARLGELVPETVA